MRCVVQRVRSASVSVSDEIVGEISQGLLVLVGFSNEDEAPPLSAMAKKLYEMRIFANAEGRFDRSLSDVDGGILLVPQFTLFAETKKGRRPDFYKALKPELAQSFFDEFVKEVKQLTEHTATGIFGADMQVALVNDGPVTIIVDL